MIASPLAAPSGGVLDTELVEPEEFLPYTEGEGHVVAGTGFCWACKREGRPNDCGGYKKPASGTTCANPKCGHDYSQHA